MHFIQKYCCKRSFTLLPSTFIPFGGRCFGLEIIRYLTCGNTWSMRLIVTTILIIIWSITANCQPVPVYDEKMPQHYDRFLNQTFPAMEFEMADSTFFNTALLANKTVYVDCWFTACPPCLYEIPFSQQLQTFFAGDTNVVFLNICIENVERKSAWKDLVKRKNIQGINVFYTRNRPQKVNILRKWGIEDFPTYFLVNNLKIIGYDAPAPSQKGFVHWAIYQASQNIPLSGAYTQLSTENQLATSYIKQIWPLVKESPEDTKPAH